MATTIQVIPESPARYCLRCERLIKEQWYPALSLCANCALEAELFDPEARLG